MLDRLQGQRWMVYILPGAISLFVAGFVSDIPPVRDVLIPFVYVALTALSVLIPLAVVQIYAVASKRAISVDSLPQNPWFITGTFVAAILFGLLFGMAHSTDVVSAWLRGFFGKNLILVSSQTEPFQLLMRESYQPSFVDEFDGVPEGYLSAKEHNIYTVITYGTGDEISTVHGVVHSYGGWSGTRQAYLSPACRETEGGVTPIPGPGTWVNLENVYSVEFLYQSCSPCAAAIKADTGNGAMSRSCPFSAADGEEGI